MALTQLVINSINSQLDEFADDGLAFDDWITAIVPHLRSYTDVGTFRTTARSFWLSNNKKAVKKLVNDTFNQPTIEERKALEAGDMAGQTFEHAYLMFLKRMGIHQGDTLTVHGKDGQIHSLSFDLAGLPAREGAKLITEPAPTPDNLLTEKKG